MKMTKSSSVIKKIANVIGNPVLARELYETISLALNNPEVNLGTFANECQVFENSLNSAIYDIEKDEVRGGLFKRLLRYGPHNPDDPEAETSDGMTMLSDPECGACVEFIFSHMINRFQGELAELLALKPCIKLLEDLKQKGEISENSKLVWGNMIREKQRIGTQWRDYAKGADGLIISTKKENGSELEILAVIEIKSMQLSSNRLLRQISHHITRLGGGVELGKIPYTSNQLNLEPASVKKELVRPSTWKLPRDVKWEKDDKGVTTLVFPKPTAPKVRTKRIEISPNTWSVTLNWSEDALRQAACEMTYGYMSEVGEVIFSDYLPKGWEKMSPAEAGYNAIKMMLYYTIFRLHYFYSKKEHRISRKERKAIHLYNIYSFEYVLGADSKNMLWPKDGKPSEMKDKFYKDEETGKNGDVSMVGRY
jgi:hypothetical protein